MEENVKLAIELHDKGGEWLGAARTWAQWHIQGGDRLCWDSSEYVSIRFHDLWDMAEKIAFAAIIEDRKRRT